jgi:hypothetical protein
VHLVTLAVHSCLALHHEVQLACQQQCHVLLQALLSYITRDYIVGMLLFDVVVVDDVAW